MKKSLFILFSLILHFSVLAQISGSLKLGLAGYQGDLHCRTDDNIGLIDAIKPSFGVGARIPFSKAVGLRAEATFFQLSGDESKFKDIGHIQRDWAFNNNFLEIAAMLDWELLGKNRFTEAGTFKKTLTPLLFGGIGLMFNNPEVDFKNSTIPDISQDKENGSKVQLALPVGLGLKYYFSENFALALETGFRLPISDYYDGVSFAANEGNNDAYGFGGLKAYFQLRKADEDGDGISDKTDVCPTIPGIKEFGGCPDTDGDSIPDKDDSCPSLFGSANLEGCPDEDKDGIADKDDSCPKIAGLAAFNGCPDTDKDGITDADDLCPNMAGTANTKGCPDSDNDGVMDSEDSCPEVAGLLSKKGCPFVDKDSDGVEDEADECPNDAGSLATKGCPDNDGDGIANKYDSCPDLAANTSSGCPQIKTNTTSISDTESMRNRLSTASRNITFETGSTNISSSSYTHLDDIISILNSYPNQNIYINGYTDNIGNDAANQRLSAARAKAARDYLIGKGIRPNRLNYQGYGEANPIASNSNAAGRRLNRRVEMVLDDGTLVPRDCDCAGTAHPIFNIPTYKTSRKLTRLGTNPEFGDSHGLSASGFYQKLNKAYNTHQRDKKFLDAIFKAMGYRGFIDAGADLFSEVVIPNGTTGQLGYSVNHKTLYATLNAASDRDLQAFRIRSANGCDLHFMKTCGNHFYFCTK